jgi:hypothetical protein
MLGTRLIPKNPDEPPTIFNVVSTKHWAYLECVKADPDNLIPAEDIFQPRGMDVTVHFVEDFIAEVQYIVIKGEDLDEMETVASAITDTVPVYTADEILALCAQAQTLEERLRALRLAGVAAPGEHNPQFFSVFAASMVAPEPVVRRAAIDMVAYAGWPELRELLTQRLTDPDEDVRQYAGYMLRALDGET